jgi:hypothetical protein
MIYNNRAGDGVTITPPAFNVSKDKPMTNPHPNPVVYLGAVLDAINADLDNPDTPMIPMHAITLIRDAFTAVGVDFDLREGVAA